MTGQGRDEGPDRAEDQRSPSRERAREMSQDGAPQRGHSRDRSLPGRRSLSGSRRSRSPQRIDRRSRSSRGSRSRSRSGGRSAVKYNGRAYYGDERVTHVMEIEDDDASFILGAGGRTKRKLSHVCGAELNIEERNGRTVLEMRGTKDTIERAKLYVGFVMQQRVGPVQLPPDAETRDDLTIIEVPHECVGYVTGRKGAGLRSVEEEWNTLMFFTDLRRARRGSELKVMSAVEQKMPGYFTDNITEGSSNNDGFDTDYVTISEKDYSYALGQRGSTRKKLARASGAILEYVGRIAFVAGTLPERMRAKQYLQWLCMQRTSFVHVDTVGRDDCEVVNLPLDAVAYVTGSKGSNLRRVEEETGTFIFLDGARGGGEERLLIFCYDVDARRRARVRIEERIDEKLSGRARPLYHGGGGGRYRSPSPRRGDYGSYGRYDDRGSYGGGSGYYGGGGSYGGSHGGGYRGSRGGGGGGYRSRSSSRPRGGYYRSRSRSAEYWRGGGGGRSRSRSPARRERSYTR
ncbi:uncharacterized protein LOC34623106 [Cyclospora cayetanensis]|uniref:Uncharacterized protein LOC34623106 n=1 Tax=Cyclospora cayetanensis TaxID=88456 RepID=A0A6P6RYK0_9EIME|nr:uncharacterized protein LOC34623106 [Cyclospora cayetanensis]